MYPRLALCLVALIAAAAAADTPRAAPASRIERTPEFVRDVGQAIDRGVEWLRSAQARDGSFFEYPGFPGATTSLAYHTLRVCGVSRDDPAATKAWKALRAEYDENLLQTYSATTYLMAIASHGDPVANAKDDRDVKLSAEDRRFAEEIARRLAAGQDREGRWSYNVGTSREYRVRGAGNYDHSNTQYALLGLKCAARCGIGIDSAVWKRSLAHFLSAQEGTGPQVRRRAPDQPASGLAPKGRTSAVVLDHARGWGYQSLGRGQGGATSSMSAGGVSSVVICRSELLGTNVLPAKLAAESEQSVWDGLAWLGTRWGVAGAPGDGRMPMGIHAGAGHALYEYYSVERAGVLAGVDWMADLDWYGLGAQELVDAQLRDGSWGQGPEGRGRNGPGAIRDPMRVVDTCFALLFLKRGTVPVRRGAVTQPRDDTDIRFDLAPTLTGKDFEDMLDLVLQRWDRATDDDVRRRLLDGAASTGPRIVEPLIVRLDDPDVGTRTSAHELLRHATDEDFGYDPTAEPERRESAVALWQAWWFTARARLVYDAALRKLVVR